MPHNPGIPDPLPALLCTVFQQANAADLNQQKSHEQRRNHGDELPATEGRQSDQRNAQPQQNLAKVVRVPGSGPQPGGDKFFRIGRVAPEHCFLVISQDLHAEAHSPDQGTQIGKPVHRKLTR